MRKTVKVSWDGYDNRESNSADYLFCPTLVGGNILQQLYNMVDSMIVGNFAARGTDALAAVGTTFP